ncbi:hypothetical protein Y032_0224g2691 [Ancylostoma ceylanicum]|uniref:Uncharacterized protein n=1 Tax=Ancylostoma ceylanicum TaxID=53326 RepID=A0A016SI32_9BILA|nr:hypothetical protein Y032_0224g2691 [Ancylostoma ceylanicum]
MKFRMSRSCARISSTACEVSIWSLSRRAGSSTSASQQGLFIGSTLGEHILRTGSSTVRRPASCVVR